MLLEEYLETEETFLQNGFPTLFNTSGEFFRTENTKPRI
jgi:hypothetical protein